MTTRIRPNRWTGNRRPEHKTGTGLHERRRQERRSHDRMNALSRQMNDVCTTAVDPYQITAALEAEGLNDRNARDYGFEDLFGLAEELYRRVPFRAALAGETTHEPEKLAFRQIIRGLLFALPGLLYFAVLDGLSDSGAILGLFVAVIFAWGWGQGMAHLFYHYKGQQHDETARRVTRIAMALGLAIAVGVSVLLIPAFGLSAIGAVLIAGQTAYLLGTSVLLVFNREYLLFALLAAGIPITFLAKAGWIPFRVGPHWVVSALVASVLVAAWWVTRPAGPSIRFRVESGTLRKAVEHGFLGVLWAILVAASALAVLDGESTIPIIGVAIVPVLISMGWAEWLLTGYRRGSRLALKSTTHPGAFARQARLVYVRMLSANAGAVSLLSLVAYAVFPDLRSTSDLLLLISYGLLGLAFFAGLILVASSRMVHSVLATIGAGAAGLAVVPLLPPGPQRYEVGYLCVALALVLIMSIDIAIVMSRATSHR